MAFSLREAKPISELCKIIDCEHKTAPYVDSSEYFVVRTSNVRNGQLVMADMKFTTHEGYQEWTQRAVPEFGDVLFTREAPAGESCLVPRDVKVCMGQRLVLLRPNKLKVDPIYLSMVLATERGKSDILRLSIGSTVSRINISDIRNIKIAAPPLAEQKKIAQILSTWDQAIATTERLLDLACQQKKALMQQLLTGKKYFPGFEGEWKTVRFGKVFKERVETGCDNLRLLSITADDGVVYQDETGRKDTSNEDKSKYRRICINDIGYNTMRMWQGRSSLSDKEGIVSPAYTIVTPSQEICPKYAAYLFKLPKLIHVFYRHSQGLVSDTWNLKFTTFAKIKWVIPDRVEQKKIAAVLSCSDQEIKALQSQLKELKQEKKALMQVLLTGKRRVQLN